MPIYTDYSYGWRTVSPVVQSSEKKTPKEKWTHSNTIQVRNLNPLNWEPRVNVLELFFLSLGLQTVGFASKPLRVGRNIGSCFTGVRFQNHFHTQTVCCRGSNYWGIHCTLSSSWWTLHGKRTGTSNPSCMKPHAQTHHHTHTPFFQSLVCSSIWPHQHSPPV